MRQRPLAASEIPGNVVFVMIMKRAVGFFGGSFDPIHFGHINLALQILETHSLEQVLFCPAFCSPFKKDHPPKASPSHRLAMLELALEEIPGFAVSRLEIDRGGVSYTIDSLRSLQSEGVALRLVLSDDAAAHFSRWKEAEEILRIAPPLVGVRGGGERGPLPDCLKKGFTSMHAMDVSSTEIRRRLNKKLYCGHLVPRKALDYIQAHQLYS